MLLLLVMPHLLTCNWRWSCAATTTVACLAAQALELQQLLPGAGPAPLDQLLSPGFVDINNPGVSWAVGNSGKQLLYPDWMEGTWQVSKWETTGIMFVSLSACCLQ